MSICSDCPLRRACGATEDRAAEAPVARIIVFGYGGFSLIQFLLTIGAFEEFDGRNSKRSAENSEAKEAAHASSFSLRETCIITPIRECALRVHRLPG